MNRWRLSLFFSLVLLCACLNCGRAQQRPILFSKGVSAQLQEAVDALRDPNTPQADAACLSWTTNYFVRIAPRANILTADNQLMNSAHPGQKDAILGTQPFVFLTSPQSLYGRSLLEIYQDIGYEAEDILRWQRDRNMVAIVFRYPQHEVSLATAAEQGQLPIGWQNKVYVPYWDTMFSLFSHLAQNATVEPERQGEFSPDKMFFRSQEQKIFALLHGEIAKSRIKKSSYGELKARGGADWKYRQLLETKLSLFEHFRGTGRTQNEVFDREGQAHGLVEFVGPNRKLNQLAEVAVVDLGRLTISDDYFPSNSGK
jgi:hypothetical protein